MKRLGSAALISLILLTSMVTVPLVSAGGIVPDAAHACQQGGYSTLQGTDGTLFTNVGECVSYVARGGTITGVSATCTYISGTSGCIQFDDLSLWLGGVGPSTTTLAGMFTFSPVTDWPAWVSGSTAASISGSGTWSTSTGLAGTWTATHASSIYPGQFYDSSGPTTCGAATVRSVGAHFDVYQDGVLVGAIEIQVRDGTTGTNYVYYQGFAQNSSGDPWGIHETTDVGGVTLHC